jgi:hypothetical protein
MELELPGVPQRVQAATKPQVASRSEIGYAQAMLSQWWLLDEGETTPELQWPRSIAVYDQMRRTDAQVTSLLEAVTLPIRRTPWRIDPAGARATVVKFVATDMGLPIVGKGPGKAPARTKGKFSWPDHLRLALLELVFGHMFFEQVYSVNDAGTEAHLKKLAPRMPSTIDQIKVASDGGLEWIKQRWTTDITAPQVIPVDRLVAYVRNREGGNWLGQSILRPAYKNWLLKDRLLRVQAQTIERNGMGIPLYKAQEDATETDIAAGKTMATLWRAGEAAGSAVPFGADLVLRGVEGTLPDADPAIRYHDEQIARAALAHFLNLGTQTGSWALGSTFEDFFVYSLQTLAQQIADVTNQHVIEDLVDLNFGENEPAPRLVFDEIGSQQPATAQALKTLVDSGIIHPDQVLEETSRQQYGLPPADPATATTPPGVATPTAAVDPTPMGAESVAAARRRRPKAQRTVEAKFNPSQPRDPGGEGGGQWTKTRGAAGALKDALKLAGKIDLAPDEKLIGSAKIDGDGGIRMALTERGGHRTLRLGLGGEDYGKANREEGIPVWDGNPPRKPLAKAELDRLDAEFDALDAEYDDASPARRDEISARQADIREQLSAGDEEFNGGTAKLDEYGMRRLADKLRPALAEAIEQEKAENAAWDEIEALQAKGNPDPARLAELQQTARAVPGSPGYDGITFDEGVIPGAEWGDVHYSVELDDLTTGVTVHLGVKPKNTQDDWGDGRTWQGQFDTAETKKFLRLLDQFSSPVQAAARRAGPPRRTVRARYNPGEMRDPGGEGGGRWIKNPATAVSAFTDGLGLDDRIELDPGDLVGSSSSVGDETDDADLNWVVVFSKEYGPEARIGVVPKAQSNDWSGNPETDSVAIFDAEAVAKIRTKLAAHVAEANKAARDADKAWRAGSPPTDPKLLGSEAVASGEAIGAADFADVAWDIFLTDDDPTSWQLNVKTSPDSEGINLGPKGAKDLLTNLDTIESELRGPSPAGEVTAGARARRRTVRARYNPSEKRDPNGKWGDGVPGPSVDLPELDLEGFELASEVDGSFGTLRMGVDQAGDVRVAFHQGSEARAVDLSGEEAGQFRDVLQQLAEVRDDMPDGSTGVVDEDWFGFGEHHRVQLHGNGLISVAFFADDDGDPWELNLDPPDGEDDDVATVVGALGEVEDELGKAVHAAAGMDTHPGGEQLKHYWLHGEGAAKWSTWTELYDHLRKYLSPGMAKRTAANWFHERYGIWPGADANRVKHGKPPRGKVVGPG